MSKELRGYIRELQKQKRELLVLIDTLQACLRRAENVLEGHEKYDYVFAQSAKWCLNWTQKDLERK